MSQSSEKHGGGSHELGSLIASQRELLGITRYRLADIIGKNQGYIWQVEKAKRGLRVPETVSLFADALGLSEEEIYIAQGILPDDVGSSVRRMRNDRINALRKAVQFISQGR